jgi:hypothetical protein
MALEVMCNDFKAIANHAVNTDDGKKIVRNRLTAMKKELATLKKEMEKRAKRSSAANPSSSVPTTSAQSRGPTPMQHQRGQDLVRNHEKLRATKQLQQILLQHKIPHLQHKVLQQDKAMI